MPPKAVTRTVVPEVTSEKKKVAKPVTEIPSKSPAKTKKDKA